MSNINDNIKQAVDAIAAGDAICITAGAGMGVDSGLPDFRGNDGFWKAYPPIAKLGIPFSEMANPKWFEEKPLLAWAFYGHRLNLYRKTVPNDGFTKLLDICKKKTGGYFVFTSNVDGQFQKAGFRNDSIVECHGSIENFQCTKPCTNETWEANGVSVEVDESKFEACEPLPLCPKCKSLARPNILMFGDGAWSSDNTDNQNALLNNWLRRNKRCKSKIVVIEVGAGISVPTVRNKSEAIAAKFGATLIRINPRNYEVPPNAISIQTGALEAINKIAEMT